LFYIVDVHVLFVPLTYEKSVGDSSELLAAWALEKETVQKKSRVKLVLTKKLFIDAAMKVPCRTWWARTKVSTLEYRLNSRQACPVHCKGVIRLYSCKSFGPKRNRWKS